MDDYFYMEHLSPTGNKSSLLEFGPENFRFSTTSFPVPGPWSFPNSKCSAVGLNSSILFGILEIPKGDPIFGSPLGVEPGLGKPGIARPSGGGDFWTPHFFQKRFWLGFFPTPHFLFEKTSLPRCVETNSAF